MKRAIVFFSALCLTVSMAACSRANNTAASSKMPDAVKTTDEADGTQDPAKAQDTGQEQITLQYMTLSGGQGLEAEKHIIKNFEEKHPNIRVEVTSLPEVDTFITSLKAKFAAGEEPDLYVFQGGTRIREFAQEGLLKDVTDEPYMQYVHEQDKPFNSLNGRIYGIPMRYEYSGLFVNRDTLSQYSGVEIPTNFQELMAACEELRRQGMENPMILAGKSINNVAQFDFQYLACVISHENPDYYRQMLDGKLKFNDEVFQKMFEKYGQLKEYVSEDSLGVDDDEAIKRFIRGEGVFWVAHGSEIARIRELGGDELDFVMVPTVLQDEDQERTFNCGQAIAIAVVKSGKHPEAVRELVTEFLLPESSNIMATEGKLMPAAVGAQDLPDPCLEPCREWFDSDLKMNHADLVWVPGIKDVMKEITQKWYMGESTDSVLQEWNDQHERLLLANPEFVENFGKD